MSRFGIWRYTSPRMPPARGFRGLGASEQTHHDKLRELLFKIRLGSNVIRKAIERGDCKRANNALETMNKNLGSARSHFFSTDSFYRGKVEKLMMDADSKTKRASEAVNKFCILDLPITSSEHFAGLRRRKRRSR